MLIMTMILRQKALKMLGNEKTKRKKSRAIDAHDHGLGFEASFGPPKILEQYVKGSFSPKKTFFMIYNQTSQKKQATKD